MLVTHNLIVNTFFLPTISKKRPNNIQLPRMDSSVIAKEVPPSKNIILTEKIRKRARS